MPTILITGPARSGKTSLAAGLLARLRDSDRSAAYLKPFSPGPQPGRRPRLRLRRPGRCARHHRRSGPQRPVRHRRRHSRGHRRAARTGRHRHRGARRPRPHPAGRHRRRPGAGGPRLRPRARLGGGRGPRRRPLGQPVGRAGHKRRPALSPGRGCCLRCRVFRRRAGGGHPREPRDARPNRGPARRPPRCRLDSRPRQRRCPGRTAPHRRQHHGPRTHLLRPLRQPGSHRPCPASRHPAGQHAPPDPLLGAHRTRRARPPTSGRRPWNATSPCCRWRPRPSRPPTPSTASSTPPHPTASPRPGTTPPSWSSTPARTPWPPGCPSHLSTPLEKSSQRAHAPRLAFFSAFVPSLKPSFAPSPTKPGLTGIPCHVGGKDPTPALTRAITILLGPSTSGGPLTTTH